MDDQATSESTALTSDQKLDLILEKLNLLLEPRSNFNIREYMKSNGAQDLPGSG